MSARVSLVCICAAALALSACDAVSNTGEKAAESVEAPASVGTTTPQAAPLTPSGPPTALTPEAATEDEDGLQWAASVVELDPIPETNAKLFGTAGGDPAMNGLYTYIAFYPSPAEGWLIYRIGDFLDYTVLSASSGRVDLDVHESVLDEASGEIGSRHRKLIVQWTPASDDVAPASVTVTAAD